MQIEELKSEEMFVLVAPDGAIQPTTFAPDFPMCSAVVNILAKSGMGKPFPKLLKEGFKIMPVLVTVVSNGDENKAFSKYLSGVDLIAKERQRQILEEGWTSEHDDTHENGELAIAGSCYAYPGSHAYPGRREMWPFNLEWFKETPKDRVRELVKAGALIAAEIDRLNRKSAQSDKL